MSEAARGPAAPRRKRKNRERRKAPEARVPAPGTRLRLVSWNVHGVTGAKRREERMAVIARLVAARRADVVLLQEVWGQGDAKVFFESLGRAGYTRVEVPGGAHWPVRTAGLLAFVRSVAGWRADRIQFHEFQAEAGDWKLWQGDGLGDKGALGFTLARGDLELAIWNTHLQAAYRPGSYAEVRRDQLVELREAIGVDARPTLLAGDLNTTPDEAALTALTGFRELTAPLRELCACGTSVQEPPTLEWLDYLFAKEPEGWRIEAEVSLLRNQRPDVPYSDHQGLDAILRVTKPPAKVSLAWLAAARLAGPTTRRELLANAALLLLGR
jgi:endonuclease/exonuclease/phosphatase family metal-dependent hydrolase